MTFSLLCSAVEREDMKEWKRTAVLLAGGMMLSGSLNVCAAGLRDVFDATYYAGSYPDLTAAFGNDAEALYQHYVTCGLSEGRSGSKVFDVAEYRSAYADLEAVFGDDWDAYVNHYCTLGKAEGRTAGVYGEISLESNSNNAVSTGNNMQQWMGIQPPAFNVASVSSEEVVSGLGTRGVREYDAAGNNVKTTWYLADGITVFNIVVVEYDGAGRKTKQASYNTDGTLKDDWSYYAVYDEQGRVTILVSYHEDGTIKQVDHYEEYAEDTNLCLRWMRYYPDGGWGVSDGRLLVYFEDGKVNANFSSGYRRIIEYNPDGSIKSQNIVE